MPFGAIIGLERCQQGPPLRSPGERLRPAYQSQAVEGERCNIYECMKQFGQFRAFPRKLPNPVQTLWPSLRCSRP